jgi:hypothetical protein
VSPVKYEKGFYIPEDTILHSHCRENLKSYTVYMTIARLMMIGTLSRVGRGIRCLDLSRQLLGIRKPPGSGRIGAAVMRNVHCIFHIRLDALTTEDINTSIFCIINMRVNQLHAPTTLFASKSNPFPRKRVNRMVDGVIGQETHLLLLGIGPARLDSCCIDRAIPANNGDHNGASSGDGCSTATANVRSEMM